MQKLDRYPNETRGQIHGASLGYAQAECAAQAEKVKYTASMKVNEQLAALHEYAIKLAETAEARLYSIVAPESPEPDNAIGACRERFPELFEGYQARVDSIFNALHRIESVLDRLEV